MEKIFKCEAILDGISTRKDRTIKLVFETNELGAEEAANAMSMRNGFGWLLFSPRQPEDSDVPNHTELHGPKRRTSSQRLRAVIWRYFEKTGSTLDFEVFYEQQLEKLIDWYKAKLN